MNILIPDEWLRDFLITDATPQDIKRFVSLCGPSVERIIKKSSFTIYDVEVTSNRPDVMSVNGFAREAAVILPRFGIQASLKHDIYALNTQSFVIHHAKETTCKLAVTTDFEINPRFALIVIDNVKIGSSPSWLRKRLELTGIRSINNVVDVTNYIMHAFGQPVHAFDYAKIKPNQAGTAQMTVRLSRKGEKLTTLDGKTYTLPGQDIVIEDGAGRLIDLCGIMGGENSHIDQETASVALFLQTYNPTHIRRTSMKLGVRTEAASLFEKGLDTELVLPALVKATELILKLTRGEISSKLYDYYHKPERVASISVPIHKINSYLGITVAENDILNILDSLGCNATVTDGEVNTTIPSQRDDIKIDVDIIEEIARIFGYHNLPNILPDTPPPLTQDDQLLAVEEDIKIRLRDWGFTETLTLSMISSELMDLFQLPKSHAYKISNPLSREWVYLRPSLIPSLLSITRENLHHTPEFKIFEISSVYLFRPGDLPDEKSHLTVVWTGERFREAVGLNEALFEILSIKSHTDLAVKPAYNWFTNKTLNLGEYGYLGEIKEDILATLGIKTKVTVLDLDLTRLVKMVRLNKQYHPLPKYPPVIEDITFILPAQTYVGNVVETINSISPAIAKVLIYDKYEDTVTFRIYYLDSFVQLTPQDIALLREKVIRITAEKHAARIKEKPELQL